MAEGRESKSSDTNKKSIEESDRLLPINNVLKIMRDNLPYGCKISSDVKERMNECVTELVGFVCNQASEEHMLPRRMKTLQTEPIITSLEELDLEIFVKPLRLYLKHCLSQPNTR